VTVTTHPLLLLCNRETIPFIKQEDKQESVHENRCWSFAKNLFRFSRRYSIVATEVSLLALNVVFLIAKADKDAPKEMTEVTLAMLSTIGVLSLHYSIDVVWKSVQDTCFGYKVKNVPITMLAGVKTLQVANNVALTAGNFYAAIQGLAGDEHGQMRTYKNMILWGEISLGAGLAITLASLFTTWWTKRQIDAGETEHSEKSIANIRFCMDKDTLWHLVEILEKLDPEDREAVVSAMKIVQNNVDTQLKVTLGGHLVLIIAGDILQAIEKAYTPNSLVSAIINCGVSTVYAAKISIEKGIEYYQRGKLDQLEVEEERRESLNVQEEPQPI
jgi:hypothetical protein